VSCSVSDILRGLTSAGLPFLFAWLFPSAVGIAAFSLLLFPSIDRLPVAREIAALGTTQRLLVMAFVAVGLAIMLNALSTPLYRILEGYLFWPSRFQDTAVKRQREKKKQIEAKARQTDEGWEQALAYEQLQRFPVSDSELAPTRLGNALRAFETYGLNRFNLDSQLLWSELWAASPESLRSEYEQSRVGVDFFISLFYLAGTFGISSIIVAIGTLSVSLAFVGIVALALMPFSYQLAAINTSYWSETYRAIINVGRFDLADSLGLDMPPTLELEREMWGVVNAFMFYPYEEEWASKLDRFRIHE